ncbi:hypothetical protein U8C37_03210 [Sinorhizobium medicae]|uniref:hypothetical protein n=1 Tax=Sinorhizobium medicae TaxID=110321 RepID=UPI002AF6B360|nr:hypothetical protein [Sinorhizobium medicae]WQO86413.1 hypothetical protein U8C37_03210 [Sinorhizobium medicae]
MPVSQLAIPNRPFATDLITGLMLPDGIFVTMLGRQNVTVQLANRGAATVGFVSVYVESLSHPGIVLTPQTHFVAPLASNASSVLAWTADFRACPPGLHRVSIIVEQGGDRARIIKKFFVLGLSFEEPDRAFVAETPEGVMRAHFGRLTKPTLDCCCGRGTIPPRENEPGREDQDPRDDGRRNGIQRLGNPRRLSSIHALADLFRGHDPGFQFCPPGYLPLTLDYEWTPTPPYSGQYGGLPFQDPWWKVVLCVIAFLLLVAAAIAEAVDGSGSVTVGGGTGEPPLPEGAPEDCCGVRGGGGGTSYVAAALVAAAAAAATVAAFTDVRDAFRRGEDATPPGDGETTVRERFESAIRYVEAVALGRPFSVNARWIYTRVTDANTYTHEVEETNQNTHVISHYEVTAPEFAVRDNPDLHWIVKAKFLDADGKALSGSELFVQCFLVGPNGEWHRCYLQDDGIWPDDAASDGTYTGTFSFRAAKAEKGLWVYYVIAQDVNHARTEMTPEEAAQIIGGLVVTHQLTISFTEDECRFVPDGHVMVV